MAKYGIDKPDLRYGMLLQDVSDILKDCALNFISNVIKEGGAAQALVVPGVAGKSRKFFDGLDKLIKSQGGGGVAWVAFTEDGGLKGSIAKKLSESEIEALKGLDDWAPVQYSRLVDHASMRKAVWTPNRAWQQPTFPAAPSNSWIVDFPMW